MLYLTRVNLPIDLHVGKDKIDYFSENHDR